MKSCPACHRTYDETLTFCLIDGSILSAPYDRQATQDNPALRETDPSATAVWPPNEQQVGAAEAPPSYPTIASPMPPAFASETRLAQPVKRRNAMLWIALGVMAFLAAGVVLVVALIWSTRKAAVTTGPSAINRNVSNSNATTNDRSSGALPSPSRPEATPSPAPQLNIVGTWTGKYTVDPGTLIISNQDGDSFSGTLNSGGYLIAVSGRVNPETRQIVFTENRILKKDTSKYTSWTMGTNTGSVSSDGQSMSGKGKAKGQAGYSWSFTKR
jgi:hypothetical protein